MDEKLDIIRNYCYVKGQKDGSFGGCGTGKGISLRDDTGELLLTITGNLEVNL